jgi:hypothetical protein
MYNHIYESNGYKHIFNCTIKILFSDERKIPARLPNLQKGRLGLEQEEMIQQPIKF